MPNDAEKILKTLERIDRSMEGLTLTTKADEFLLVSIRLLLAKLSLSILKSSNPPKAFKSPELENKEER